MRGERGCTKLDHRKQNIWLFLRRQECLKVLMSREIALVSVEKGAKSSIFHQRHCSSGNSCSTAGVNAQTDLVYHFVTLYPTKMNDEWTERDNRISSVGISRRVALLNKWLDWGSCWFLWWFLSELQRTSERKKDVVSLVLGSHRKLHCRTCQWIQTHVCRRYVRICTVVPEKKTCLPRFRRTHSSQQWQCYVVRKESFTRLMSFHIISLPLNWCVRLLRFFWISSLSWWSVFLRTLEAATAAAAVVQISFQRASYSQACV